MKDLAFRKQGFLVLLRDHRMAGCLRFNLCKLALANNVPSKSKSNFFAPLANGYDTQLALVITSINAHNELHFSGEIVPFLGLF